MAMSSTHVAVASRDAVYLWQFTTARSLGLSHLDKISNREKLVLNRNILLTFSK